jgi:hypothetical protein
MFVDAVDWTNAHGTALLASALFFKHRLSEFHVPSSYVDGTYPRWGTHPQLDPLLSTESMTFVHHGTEVNRVQKLELIAQRPMSYERLRVCWIQDIGLRNCGNAKNVCEHRSHSTSWADFRITRRSKSGHWTTRRFAGFGIATHQSRVFARELMREAIRRGKLHVWGSLGYSLIRREVFHRWQRI